MMTETTVRMVFASYTIGYVAVCIVLPFNRVLRTGSFWRGVLLAWLAVAVYTFLGSMIWLYLYRSGERKVLDVLPDGQHFMAAAALGWWNGMIICLPAWIIRRRRDSIEGKHNSLHGSTESRASTAPSAP